MSVCRRYLTLLPLLIVLALCGACSESAPDEFTWQPVFGDDRQDLTAVVARVAGVEITEEDLEFHLEELGPQAARRYEGAEGRRLLLKKMIDEVLLVRGAVDRELYNDREVARTLITQRRLVLSSAMRGVGLFRDAEPTDEQLHAHFTANRDRYMIKGKMRARHIECLTRETAQEAYDRLIAGGPDNKFPYVVADLSVNEGSRQQVGELGWFNEGGNVGFISNSAEFTRVAFELERGLHPPVQVGDRWHVIEVDQKEARRPMSFGEARNNVREDIMPGFQQSLVNEFLAESRERYAAEMLGEYAPGGGLTDEEIFARAVLTKDPEKQLGLLAMVYEDFPDGERADDALFMAAQTAMDNWQDRRQAALFLTNLVEKYPNSELFADAQYLLENIDNPNAWAPTSIEELRR